MNGNYKLSGNLKLIKQEKLSSIDYGMLEFIYTNKNSSISKLKMKFENQRKCLITYKTYTKIIPPRLQKLKNKKLITINGDVNDNETLCELTPLGIEFYENWEHDKRIKIIDKILFSAYAPLAIAIFVNVGLVWTLNSCASNNRYNVIIRCEQIENGENDSIQNEQNEIQKDETPEYL